MLVVNLEADEFTSLSWVVQVKKKDRGVTINLPYLKTAKQGDLRQWNKDKWGVFLLWCPDSYFHDLRDTGLKGFCHEFKLKILLPTHIWGGFATWNNPKDFKSPLKISNSIKLCAVGSWLRVTLKSRGKEHPRILQILRIISVQLRGDFFFSFSM